MSQADLAVVAIATSLTVCCVDRFIDRIDNVRNKNSVIPSRELIATTRTSYTSNQVFPPQL
jgi:hypothetical protein